jgi:hypothetical protein
MDVMLQAIARVESANGSQPDGNSAMNISPQLESPQSISNSRSRTAAADASASLRAFLGDEPSSDFQSFVLRLPLASDADVHLHERLSENDGNPRQVTVNVPQSPNYPAVLTRSVSARSHDTHAAAEPVTSPFCTPVPSPCASPLSRQSPSALYATPASSDSLEKLASIATLAAPVLPAHI